MKRRIWRRWIGVGLCAFVLQVGVIRTMFFSGDAETTEEKLDRKQHSPGIDTTRVEADPGEMIFSTNGTVFTEPVTLMPYETVRGSVFKQGVTLASWTIIMNSVIYHKKGTPCFAIPPGVDHVFLSGNLCEITEPIPEPAHGVALVQSKQ